MPKVTGPKNGKYVTASFDSKDKKDNSKSRFPSLKTTKDLVLLSIKGNEYCAGEYLEAIVQQAVATHQTTSDSPDVKGKTTFLIADEIYWHNLKKTPEDAEAVLKQQALDLGESYFEKNLSAFLAPLGLTPEVFNGTCHNKSMDEKIAIINQLAVDKGKNFEIVRWHTWVSQNGFEKTSSEIMPLYTSVEGLKLSIDKSVDEFARRHAQEEGGINLWRDRSRNYLTQESPSIMLLAASLGYNFIIYPGSILPPFVATKEYFVVEKHVPHIEKGRNIVEPCHHDKHSIHVDKPSLLVNWLEVNFKRSHENLATNGAKAPQNAPKVGKVAEAEKTKRVKEEEHIEQEEEHIEKEKTEGELNDEGGQQIVVANTDKLSNALLSFFSPRSRKKALAGTVSTLSGTQSDEPVVTDLVTRGVEKEKTVQSMTKQEMASSVVTGIGRALQEDALLSRGRRAGMQLTESPLAQVFAGITQGVLAADLPASEKVAILTEIVDNFLEHHIMNPHIMNPHLDHRLSPEDRPRARLE